MKKSIGVGMIGYRFMGKAHSHAYRDVGMFFNSPLLPAMKAICGRNEVAVREAQRIFGWESYETSWEKLIERDDINLVDITTPNAYHAEIAIAAAEAGKHVFCEKPLAVSVDEAKRMLKAVREKKVVHMVAFNYRKVPAVTLARQMIGEGKLGRIYHFRALFLQDWIMDPEFPLVWRLRKEEAGSGALGDLGAHLIDLAFYLVGEFDEVLGLEETFIKERPIPEIGEKLETGLTRKGGKVKGKVTVDDAALFLARFRNGALGSFETTRFAGGHRTALNFEINGSGGSIAFNFEDMNTLKFYSMDDPEGRQGFRKIQVTEKVHPYVYAWWPPGHILGYEHTTVHLVADLLDAIGSGRQASPDFSDGVAVQAVLEAVDESSRRKEWVKVRE